MNKCGILGEGILMMYRLALVAFIAFVILGVSSVFYNHTIDVRDAEAVIMTRNVVDCLAPEGLVDLGEFGEEESVGVLSYCGFGGKGIDRFYVNVDVIDEGGEVVSLSQGDSGAKWILEIYRGLDSVTEDLRKYEPGYSKRSYDVIVLDGEESGYGKVEVEVLVKDG